MDFTNINDLNRYINQSIVRAMDDKLNSEVREILAEEIDYMYSEFQPNTYIRRYDDVGGFADPNMIEVKESLRGNGYSLEFTNEAIANGDEEEWRLDSIIEYGKDYHWKRQPPPRPVIARSIERINDEKIVEMSLRSGLSRQGIKIEER